MAQEFPNLKYKNAKVGTDKRVLFDRIVCDVPCSSDAAIRKIPQKWASWNTKDGASLHPIQRDILKRGIELLKVGGKVTYSTCSLNPIENEAVVAAALKEFKGKIRLVETGLPNFRFMPGLTRWKVMNSRKAVDVKEGESYFEEYQKYSDVPISAHNIIKNTMFMNEYDEDILAELPKSLRLMPHYQNTGGFFIAVIEKIAECDGAEPDIAQE